MERKFVSMNEVAEMLGITVDQVTEKRSRGDIYGYRDGTTWKFKMDQVEHLASKLGVDLNAQDSSTSAIDFDIPETDLDLNELTNVGELPNESVLLSGDSLTSNEHGAASTIIGQDDGAIENNDLEIPDQSSDPADDDQQITDPAIDSDVKLVVGGSDVLSDDSEILNRDPADTASSLKLAPSDSDTINVADLNPELGSHGIDDELLTLGENKENDNVIQHSLDAEDSASPGEPGVGTGDSAFAIDVNNELDDDDLVLGSGVHNDITLDSADSGINLAGLTDSGISLDSNSIDLSSSSVDALELPTDGDSPSRDEPADTDRATEWDGNEPFLLEPGFDGSDEEESGSQVIALDSEENNDRDAATMLGANLEAGADDEPVFSPDTSSSLTGTGSPIVVPNQANEAPYTVWNVVPLFFIMIFLIFTGMMMTDLMGSMWSWSEPHAYNSRLMDWIIEMLGETR